MEVDGAACGFDSGFAASVAVVFSVGAVACGGSAALDLGAEQPVVPESRATNASGNVQGDSNRIYINGLPIPRPVQNPNYDPEMVLSRKSLGQSTESVI